jgi:adenine/guanine phosphoribosyltransferase-like PRPP-binding protein
MQEPHLFWQELIGQELRQGRSHDPDPPGGHRGGFPATLPDGRQLLLPIRALPGPEGNGVASLILNQASFAVHDALADALAEQAAALEPGIVIGLPTLGLSLASAVARRLGHARFVALGTSRKFWYEDALSAPLRSITSPDQQKTLYLDPRMRPVIAGRRVLLIDDVLSTGSSIIAALTLLRAVAVEPVAIGAAMLQSGRWRGALAGLDPPFAGPVLGVLETPLLKRLDGGGWAAA